MAEKALNRPDTPSPLPGEGWGEGADPRLPAGRFPGVSLFRADSRLGLMLVVSILLHAAILAVHFTVPYAKRIKEAPPNLQIVLVNAKTASRPDKADALAQADLDGGGNTAADRQAKSPLPAADTRQPDPAIEQQERRVREMEEQAQSLMTRLKSPHRVDQTRPVARPQQAATPSPAPNAAELVQKSMEAARLQAQIAKDWDAYQTLPKRTFIGAQTREYRFARYVEDWRIKVERVGNLNYPEAARQQKIYGSLQLTVSIRADGSVESIEITRSSGHKVLDEAARRIVELAAPYSPLPPDIRKDTDILGITRTWTFTRADRLTSE